MQRQCRRKSTMGTKIFIGVAVIIYSLFLLSVFAPVRSEKKFWRIIYKIRAVMDWISYWFFNLCAISAAICVIWLAITHIFWISFIVKQNFSYEIHPFIWGCCKTIAIKVRIWTLIWIVVWIIMGIKISDNWNKMIPEDERYGIFNRGGAVKEMEYIKPYGRVLLWSGSDWGCPEKRKDLADSCQCRKACW